VARLRGTKRQKNQLELAFGEGMKSEARSPSSEGTEAPWRSAVQKAWLRKSNGWRRSVRERTSGRRSSV